MNLRPLLLAAALALPGVALAVDRYYAECASGAHASCVPGNDANDGLSPATPKRTAPTATQYNAASCGDRFLFAAGGSWTGYQSNVIDHGQNCQANPVVLADSYAPPSGATGAPKLRVTASGGNGFLLGGWNNTTDDRGYVIRGIELFSDAVDTSNATVAVNGILIFGRTSFVTIEDITIRGFVTGFYAAPNNSLTTPSIDHVLVRRCTITGNNSMGLLGAANDWTVEDCDISNNNFSGSGLNHALYLNASGIWAIDRVTFRRNTLNNNSIARSWSVYYTGTPGVCTGGNVTMHGTLRQVTIERNEIKQQASTATCYGVSVTTGYPGQTDETFDGIKVLRNKIVNLGQPIAYESAPGIEIDGNVIVNLLAYTPNAYIWAASSPEAQTWVKIRNNSIYAYDGTAIDAAPPGSPTNQVVANNLVVFWRGSGIRTCFNHAAKSAYAEFNGNLCYGQSRFSATYATGAEDDNCPSGAASFDCNGVRANPLIVTPSAANGYSMQLSSPASPAIGAGRDAHCTRLTFTGRVRTGNCTIGAYQYGLDP